jgi:hypothetical protein
MTFLATYIFFFRQKIEMNNTMKNQMAFVLFVLLGLSSFAQSNTQPSSQLRSKPLKPVVPPSVYSSAPNSASTMSNNQVYPITISANNLQNQTQETSTIDYNAKWNAIPENIKQSVISSLQQVYGDSYDQLVKDKNSILFFYADFYQRCEIVPLSEAPENSQNITSNDLFEKYNPSYVYSQNDKAYINGDFNLFIFRYNYYSKSDLFFKLYNSNFALKINHI